MKSAILCGAVLLALGMAATAAAAGPGQKYGGYCGGGGCNCGQCQQNGWANGLLGGHLGHNHGYGGCSTCGYGGYGYGSPGYDISPNANYYAQWYGRGHGAAFGVPALAPPVYTPGPPTAAVTYPYYTTRGPRDFLLNNPPPLGP